jgi:methylisocitrate lyase
VRVPVLANITECGQTPLFTAAELGSAGVRLVLYPLSAFRAMSKAALSVYQQVRTQGTQKGVLDLMQTRAELYDVLGYQAYEAKLDELFGKASS